jgi:hypothetical protein
MYASRYLKQNNMHKGEESLLTVHLLLKLLLDCGGLCAASNTTIVIGNANASKTIVIGYLMDQLAPPYRIGAIQIAIEEGQAYGLLPEYNFRLAQRYTAADVRHIETHPT